AGMFITSLASVGMLWLGGQRVLSGALTIGELLFVFMLLTTLLEPLNRLATVNLKIQDALVAVDRLFQVLDLETEPRGDNRVPFTGLTRDLELRNVTFSYGSRGNVLEDVSLRVPAGQTVAIVGESGCGKSTLLKLLLRFHSPNQGQILLDGTDLRDFDLTSVRDRCGMVTQDTFVFDATIRENISLGAPQASLAEVVAAARSAGLDEFINSLPQRYDTIVGERGANLSGGQRQRLAIARALVNRPDVLVFDEATSQLDTTTERHIQDNLRTALAGQTVILVAHRLSTVRDADLIYVLDKGRVAEQGTHSQLLAASGHYAALWRSQTSIHGHGEEFASPDMQHLPANRIAHVLNEG
ncbi:MAG: ABC transporter ATP-binding protein, partial [Pirellulales bacterium]